MLGLAVLGKYLRKELEQRYQVMRLALILEPLSQALEPQLLVTEALFEVLEALFVSFLQHRLYPISGNEYKCGSLVFNTKSMKDFYTRLYCLVSCILSIFFIHQEVP